MYMSRLALDAGRRETMRALQEPQILHRAVESAFPGERERRLWRIDWLGDTCWLLIVSRDEPDMGTIQRPFGFPSREKAGVSKRYAPFLNRLEKGQIWRFRLKANPVVSVAVSNRQSGERGKVHAHVTQRQQKEWLAKRANKYGFEIQPDGFDVTHTSWHRFEKTDGEQVTLRTAVFEGWMVVSDADLLRKTLCEGIGRAKAYGCGMMTLARLPAKSDG